MTVELTAEQQQAIQRGEAVRLSSTDLGELVLLPASTFVDLLSEQDKAAWAKLARKAATRWAQENPF